MEASRSSEVFNRGAFAPLQLVSGGLVSHSLLSFQATEEAEDEFGQDADQMPLPGEETGE